jgi:hypothetical protein
MNLISLPLIAFLAMGMLFSHMVKVNVKQSYYTHGEAQRVPGS